MKLKIFLGALLVVSLMLNAILISTLNLERRHVIPSTQKCGIPLQAATPQTDRQPDDCLKKEGSEESFMVLGMMIAGLAARKTEQAASDEPVDAGTDLDAGVPSDDTLCSIAETTLRRDWHGKSAEILAEVRRSLTNPEEQERNFKNEIKRFSDALQLSDEDRQRLEQKYRGIRETHEAGLRSALSKDPVDYLSVIDETRGLFSDTDRLAGELFGSDAGKRLGNTEREGRLTILAIIASTADVPWEQATKGF